MFCQKCGLETVSGAYFCHKSGTKIFLGETKANQSTDPESLAQDSTTEASVLAPPERLLNESKPPAPSNRPTKLPMSGAYMAVFWFSMAFTAGQFLVIAEVGSINHFPTLIWGLSAVWVFQRKDKELAMLHAGMTVLDALAFLLVLSGSGDGWFFSSFTQQEVAISAVFGFLIHLSLWFFFKKQLNI